ncbi:gluconate kinase [Subtercola boreus]|uniref:Gluconokinase n=2 Tax=Subtercola boreus TaxID=120213 RepID=A0A3E0VN57_9MICO|nr:gluconate kinase [Subtercola boreus]
MGVSGCGKSTVGALLAARLGVGFLDADSLHPVENLRKMAAGVPLTDSDRWPWLSEVADAFERAAPSDGGLVIACSALRRAYRDSIRSKSLSVHFVHLVGTESLLQSRLVHRANHFMPAALLSSQIETLEELEADELGTTIDISMPAERIVELAARSLAL